jgi:CRISPR-associated protein Csx3
MTTPTLDIRTTYHGAVIAAIGPPHSGKSVFLAELYRQLLQLQPSRVFLHRACPDGEGMWSNEANPEVVQQIRKKSAFTNEFISVTLQSIERLGRNTRHDIVLLDLGGKRTAENAEILRRSTHCIILSSQVESILAWEAFAMTEGCQPIAELCSQLIYVKDSCGLNLDLSARSTLQANQFPVRGTLVNLCRDRGIECYRETVSILADRLLTLYSLYSG